MKRLLKTKKRPSKRRIGLKHIRKIFTIVKIQKKELVRKLDLIPLDLSSPFNSSQYLVENDSTPFLEEDDDNDLDMDFTPNPVLLMKENENIKNVEVTNSRKNSSSSTLNKSSVNIPVGA